MKNSFLLFAVILLLASCSSNRQTTAYVEDDIYWTASDDEDFTDYNSFTPVEEESEYYNEGEAKALEEGTVVNNYYGDSYYGNNYNNRRFRRFHAIYGFSYFNPYSAWGNSFYYDPWRPYGWTLSFNYNPWGWGNPYYNPYGWNGGFAFNNPYYGFGNPYFNNYGWGGYYGGFGGNGYYNGCPGYGGYYAGGYDTGAGSNVYYGGRTPISASSNTANTNSIYESLGANGNISAEQRPKSPNTKENSVIPLNTTRPSTPVSKTNIMNTRPLSAPKPINRVENDARPIQNISEKNKERYDRILNSNDQNKPVKRTSNRSDKNSRSFDRGSKSKNSKINRNSGGSKSFGRSKSSGNSRSISTPSRSRSNPSSGSRSSGSSRGRK